MFDTPERRQHPRYPIILSVTLAIGPDRASPSPADPAPQRSRATLMDLSRGGLFLKSPLAIELGHAVEVHFRARPAYACHAFGRVVRIMTTRMLTGFGVTFDRINDNFDKFLVILDRLKPELRSQFLRQVLDKSVDITLVSAP
jgi:hypothetical protein